ncbi:O-antigen ligase family protein [Aliarcobacter butzleri]|uniref:O-antigen ligase family protein n=1 Tax=Aliarcobacter butzleri TaxID=28197 RepID=UPI00138E252B|nr:O-antigen ligase family protein [Aliarcobacter butzleri]
MNKPLLLFSIFILYAILSLLWSDNIKVGIKELEYYKYYPIITLVFFSSFNKEDVKMAFYIISLSFGVYALFSLSIYFELFTILKDGVIKSDKTNPRGILPYALVTFYMAINIFLSVYFFTKEKSLKIKYIFLIIAFISLITMLVNNGRMGQLSFIGTLFIIIIYYKRYFFQYKKILVSLILALIMSIYFLFSIDKVDRYLKGFNELTYSYENNKYNGSWGARLYFGKLALEIINKNLFFGIGVGDSLDEFRKYQMQTREMTDHIVVKQYHNQHFELLTKFGIVGYSLFLFGIFLLLKILYRKDKYFFYIGLAFFSMFFMAGLGDGILRMASFDNFFILVFVLLAITLQERNCHEN